MKIENLSKNALVIHTFGHGAYLVSYTSVIAYRDNTGKITLDARCWNYSATTAKHRTLFLNETTEQTQAKIDSGEYKLDDLNQ